MMLICPACQEKHPLDRKACTHCGTKLDHVRCFACGKWVPGDQTRCPSCKSQLPVVLLMLGQANQENQENRENQENQENQGLVGERYRVLEELDEGLFLVQDTLINREIPASAFHSPTPLMQEYLRLSQNPWVPNLLDRFCEGGVERLFIEPRINAYGTPLPSIGAFWSNLREEERIRLLRQWLELTGVFDPRFQRTILDRNNLVIGNYRLFVQRIIPGSCEAPMRELAEEWRTLMGEPTGPLADILARLERNEPKELLIERLNALLLEPRIKLEHVAKTDVGRLRDHNEDNFYALSLDFHHSSMEGEYRRASGVYSVCDGMGGHEGGEVASAMAVEAIAQAIVPLACTPDLTPSDLQPLLVEAIRSRINEPIFQQNLAIGLPDQRRMGCTIILMLVLGRRAVSAHIGDSRLYFLNRREIQALTKDHNVANWECQLGHISQEECDRLSRTGIGKALTQALGPRGGKELHPEVQFYDLDSEGVFLLCSDGLTDMVPDELIHETVLKHWDNLKDASQALIDVANARGGADNITVVLVRVSPEPDFFRS